MTMDGWMMEGGMDATSEVSAWAGCGRGRGRTKTRSNGAMAWLLAALLTLLNSALQGRTKR
jgi:hypothetical protein